MASGIYQISNSVNRKRYIGSAVNLKQRWREHVSSLRHGYHSNAHLQAAFNKYGEESFGFSVLEEVKTEMLIAREQHYLDTMKPEYNLAPVAGSTLGYRHTDKARRKISDGSKGRCHSEETRRKLSKIHKGKSLTEEHRAKLSAAKVGERHPNYGKHLALETRRKIGEGWTLERRQKASEMMIRANKLRRGTQHPMYGKHLSDETKRKMSKAQKARWRRIRAAQSQELGEATE